MPDRTTETTVTFEHPFMLGSFDAAQPSGCGQAFPVDPAELQSALAADPHGLPAGSGRS